MISTHLQQQRMWFTLAENAVMTQDGHADTHGAAHTSTGLSNNKLGMWLFLGSECLLFGGLISTYMLYRGRVGEGPRPSQVFDIPFTSVSSFVLLMSSLTMVLAVSAAHKGDDRNTSYGPRLLRFLEPRSLAVKCMNSPRFITKEWDSPPASSRQVSMCSPDFTECTSP